MPIKIERVITLFIAMIIAGCLALVFGVKPDIQLGELGVTQELAYWTFALNAGVAGAVLVVGGFNFLKIPIFLLALATSFLNGFVAIKVYEGYSVNGSISDVLLIAFILMCVMSFIVLISRFNRGCK